MTLINKPLWESSHTAQTSHREQFNSVLPHNPGQQLCFSLQAAQSAWTTGT